MASEVIKVCPCCGEPFTLQDIVFRRDILPIGMLLEDDDHRHNFYYFNHLAPSCGTTFTIPVELLRAQIVGEIPSERLSGTARCGRHCLDLADTGPCDRECAYAPYRRLLQYLKDVRRADRASTPRI